MSPVSAFRQNFARLPRLVRNRYVLTVLAFAVYITFFDHYSLVDRARLNQTLRDLQAEKAQYTKTIEDSKQLRETIEADEVKFAREQYFLKHANEDVYVFE